MPTSRPQRRIVVIGEGEAAVAPDMAVLSLSVMREAMTAREALDANNKAMAEVIAAMKASGIADRDLQTAGVQISPRYDYANKPDGTQEAKLAAYQVTNTLSVRVRDLAKTGEILDKSVSLGVNQGGGIGFTNDDPSATLKEARKKAVADASKAKTLTEAAGVELGQMIEISDMSYASRRCRSLRRPSRAERRRRAGRGRRKRLQGPGQRDVRAELTAASRACKKPRRSPPGLLSFGLEKRSADDRAAARGRRSCGRGRRAGGRRR